jgi:hypothetical protein
MRVKRKGALGIQVVELTDDNGGHLVGSFIALSMLTMVLYSSSCRPSGGVEVRITLCCHGH